MKSANKKKRSFSDQQEIVLSEKHSKLRIFLAIVCLTIGVGAVGYGVSQLLSIDKGWREIEVKNTDEINCSEDFVFFYNLGASGIGATEEYKKISNLYSEATMKAYQLFTSYSGYEGINNVYYINQNPNKEIEVDEVLYRAFELLVNYQNRNVYLAPISMYYGNIFYMSDESELVYYDPYTSEDIAAYYQEVAAFATDPEAVNLELLGDNRVILHVSDEYLKYAKENAITSYIDFSWMKNAFIVDYLADIMIENGFTLGTISSFDGFIRNLDDSETSYSFNIYDRPEQSIYIAATANYSGTYSIVFLRNYGLNDKDENNYYTLSNGEVRTSYLDVKDGMCRSAANNLVSYSEKKGCAEVLLHMIPIYVTETLQEDALWKLAEEEIYSVYCEKNVIHYNDSAMEFTDLYAGGNINYTTLLIEE